MGGHALEESIQQEMHVIKYLPQVTTSCKKDYVEMPTREINLIMCISLNMENNEGKLIGIWH